MNTPLFQLTPIDEIPKYFSWKTKSIADAIGFLLHGEKVPQRWSKNLLGIDVSEEKPFNIMHSAICDATLSSLDNHPKGKHNTGRSNLLLDVRFTREVPGNIMYTEMRRAVLKLLESMPNDLVDPFEK